MQKHKWKTKIGTEKEGKEQKTLTNIIDINPTLSVITLNIKSLSSPIKITGIGRVE